MAETSTGNIETELQFGQTYTRPVGVEHNIINPGEKEFAFVEVELKYEGAAQQPANRCGALDMRLLDMNCQALALTGRGVASGLAG